VFDEVARGSGIRAVSSVRTAARCGPERILQSLSTAESPKQDRCDRPSANYSDITATVTAGAVARAGSSEGMRGEI
jgi:hypothetical protein